MKTIEQMLRNLVRTDVSEFAVASGRLPCIKVGGAYQPIDDVAPSSDQIMQMLVAVGGSRYVDSLGPKPTQWTTRVDGVGAIAIAAVMRDDKVQARFVVSRRETDAPPPSSSSRNAGAPGQIPVPRAPSIAGSPAPAPVAARAPSVQGVVAPRAPTNRRAPEVDDEPTVERNVPNRLSPPTPSPVGEPMRMIDLSREPDEPTRPGTASMSIELDLERAVAAATVGTGSSVPMGTTRDLEFDEETGRATMNPSPTTTRAGDTVLLDEMLEAARRAGASDLHIVSERPLLYRIAGELVPRGEALSPQDVEAAIVPRIPIRLRDQLEKDGSCDFALQHAHHGRFRINVSRQRTGLKVCMRLIAPGIPTLESLGLPPEIAKATHHHQGLIVLTGPTGHGKTSTLAAIVNLINSETTHHVITVEDPIEFIHPRKKALMSQREVGAHTMSFANALKASLREDPDVIVVGELRDTETVRMALAASETGHLVLGTMNTPSAAKTIDRLIDLFPPADQGQVRLTLAGGLRLIVSQRLVPSPDGKTMAAAAELLPGSVALWSLIRDAKTFQIPSLQQRGKGAGIIRLDDSLAELVRSWKTTRENALAVAESPDELDAILSGKRAPLPGGAGAMALEPKPAAPGPGLFQKAGSIFGGKKG